MNKIYIVRSLPDADIECPDVLRDGPIESLWSLFSRAKGMSPLARNIWRLFTSNASIARPITATSSPAVLSAARSGERLVLWTQRTLVRNSVPSRVLIFGATDRSTSPDIQPFLNMASPRVRNGEQRPDYQIRLRDRRDAIPALTELGIRPTDEDIWLVHPFRANIPPLDLGRFVQAPRMAPALARLLIGAAPELSQRPLYTAARQLTGGMVISLNQQAGMNWTQRDLLSCAGSPEQIAAITRTEPFARRLADEVLCNPKLAGEAVNLITERLDPLRQIAHLRGTTCAGVWLMADGIHIPPPQCAGIEPFSKEPMNPMWQ